MLASPLPTRTCEAAVLRLRQRLFLMLCSSSQCVPVTCTHWRICAVGLRYVHPQKRESAAGAARHCRGPVAKHWEGRRGGLLLCNRKRAAVLWVGLLWLCGRLLIS